MNTTTPTTLTFVFRHPPPAVSPNARSHFQLRAKALRLYRLECWRIASNEVRMLPAEERAALGLPWTSAVATVTWLVTDPKRKRDIDNCMASCKVLFDSLEGLIYDDDCHLRPVLADPFFVRAAKRFVGVRVELTRGAE